MKQKCNRFIIFLLWQDNLFEGTLIYSDERAGITKTNENKQITSKNYYKKIKGKKPKFFMIGVGLGVSCVSLYKLLIRG